MNPQVILLGAAWLVVAIVLTGAVAALKPPAPQLLIIASHVLIFARSGRGTAT